MNTLIPLRSFQAEVSERFCQQYGIHVGDSFTLETQPKEINARNRDRRRKVIVLSAGPSSPSSPSSHFSSSDSEEPSSPSVSDLNLSDDESSIIQKLKQKEMSLNTPNSKRVEQRDGFIKQVLRELRSQNGQEASVQNVKFIEGKDVTMDNHTALQAFSSSNKIVNLFESENGIIFEFAGSGQGVYFARLDQFCQEFTKRNFSKFCKNVTALANMSKDYDENFKKMSKVYNNLFVRAYSLYRPKDKTLQIYFPTCSSKETSNYYHDVKVAQSLVYFNRCHKSDAVTQFRLFGKKGSTDFSTPFKFEPFVNSEKGFFLLVDSQVVVKMRKNRNDEPKILVMGKDSIFFTKSTSDYFQFEMTKHQQLTVTLIHRKVSYLQQLEAIQLKKSKKNK